MGIGRRPAQRDDALLEESCGFLGTFGLIAGGAAEVQISDLLYDGGTYCTAGVQSPGNRNAVDVADADHRDRNDEDPPFGPPLVRTGDTIHLTVEPHLEYY